MLEEVQEKNGNENEKITEIYSKYLFSMKFYYRSKIVGVECRIKTDKGTKHVNIGICEPHIEHELLTLVNRKVVTIGSYWHGKEMIGISVWYIEKLLTNLDKNKTNSSKKLEAKKSRQTY